MPDRHGLPTKSEQKYASVLAVVEAFELEKKETESMGCQFKAPTKSKIQRLAKVSKNYLDLLAKNDDLYVRVEALRSRPVATRKRLSVEEARLAQIRKLEDQLQKTNTDNTRLRDEKLRLILELRQATAQVEQLLDYCLSIGKELPKLEKVFDNNKVVEFPRHD